MWSLKTEQGKGLAALLKPLHVAQFRTDAAELALLPRGKSADFPSDSSWSTVTLCTLNSCILCFQSFLRFSSGLWAQELEILGLCRQWFCEALIALTLLASVMRWQAKPALEARCQALMLQAHLSASSTHSALSTAPLGTGLKQNPHSQLRKITWKPKRMQKRLLHPKL